MRSAAARRDAPRLPFERAAGPALQDDQTRANVHRATTTIRARRAAVVGETPDWAELRAAGAAIRERAVLRLDELLVRLEAAVTAAGGVVHWARDATEANAVVVDLVERTGSREVVKVKSLTTDELGLNDALLESGIEPIETDLAERIVQLAGERPSHLLVPSLHRGRPEIAELLREAFDEPGLTDDPESLLAAARRHLRDAFLRARVAVSGANFAVAQTGTVGVVESEGNGRMCTTLPETLVTVMGVEKVVEEWRDLGVLMQLLPRSATGERMNPYTSLWTGVAAADGPRRSTSCSSTPADPGARGSRGTARPQVHPLLGLRQCLPGLPADRRPRLRHGLSRPDRRDPAAAALRRARHLGVAAVRLDALRRLRGRLPGRDRHPADPRPRAGEGRAESAAGRRGAGAPRARALVLEHRALRARAADGARAAAAARQAGRLRWLPGPLAGWGRSRTLPGVAAADLPRVVGGT